MTNNQLLVLFLIVVALLILVSYFALHYRKKVNELKTQNQIQFTEEFDDFESTESETNSTIYNSSPIGMIKMNNTLPKNIPQHHVVDRQRYNIFIVESHEVHQKLLLDMLKDEYNVFFYYEGHSLLNDLTKMREENQWSIPHLMIIHHDNDNRTLNGLDLFDKIKQNYYCYSNKIPVFITHNGNLFVKKDKDYAICEQINKPIQETELKTKIKKYL